MTICRGASARVADRIDMESLMHAADNAVYAAKRSGRIPYVRGR